MLCYSTESVKVHLNPIFLPPSLFPSFLSPPLFSSLPLSSTFLLPPSSLNFSVLVFETCIKSSQHSSIKITLHSPKPLQ